MTTTIETLEEAIENGLTIRATYTNGEVVKVLEFAVSTKVEVEFQDGTLEAVDRNDLIDFSWK